MSEAERFIECARALIGRARWRHRGRKPWAVDCVGLIAVAAREAGIADKFRLGREYEIGYGREPWDDQLRAHLRGRFGNPLQSQDAKPGDIALIRWGSGEPSHVAIIADHPDGGLSMIHSHNIAGVTEHRLAHPFDSCIVEIYRPWHDTSYQ